MSYTVAINGVRRSPKIVVVGCGGTGGFVAEGMCRLLKNTDLELLLIDHDRVEPHNLVRQNFLAEDLDKFKSQALAERLARQYGRRVGYSVYPYDREILDEEVMGGLGRSVGRGIIIGCVDNPAARRMIAKNLQWEDWWIDAGNGYQSGQVLIGDTDTVDKLEGSFNDTDQLVQHLPMPALQLPTLLTVATEPETRQQDCAEAVEDNLQSPVINQVMATLVLDIMYKLLAGKLTWMGVYVDMEAGTLKPVEAEPETVARMFGIKTNSLMYHIEGCHIGGRREMLGRDPYRDRE